MLTSSVASGHGMERELEKSRHAFIDFSLNSLLRKSGRMCMSSYLCAHLLTRKQIKSRVFEGYELTKCKCRDGKRRSSSWSRTNKSDIWGGEGPGHVNLLCFLLSVCACVCCLSQPSHCYSSPCKNSVKALVISAWLLLVKAAVRESEIGSLTCRA